MKQFLYLVIVVASVALVILIGYFLRYRAGEPSLPELSGGGLPQTPSQKFSPPTSGGQTGAGGQTPGQSPASIGGQKFGVVSQGPALNFFVDDQNNATIVQPDGQIVKITSGGSSLLSSSGITNLISAEFSYNGAKILAVFGNSASPEESVFDVAGKSWQPLPAKLISAVWSPKDYRIAYFKDAGGTKALTVLDTSDPKAKPLELARIHAEDLESNWINPNQIILSDKGSSLSGGSVWSFDLKQKTLKQIVNNKLGLDSVWNGTANLGLVFGINRKRLNKEVGLLDTAGNVLKNLTFLTLPSKCAFDVVQVEGVSSGAASSTSTATTSTKKTQSAPTTIAQKKLYCAVPRDSQKLGISTLPDDYQKGILFTSDDFYKINLSDGNVESLFADQSQVLDATNLKIYNQALFFINRLDQKLYAISLK